MITGAIKTQVDQLWNAFWSGGISNPIEVIEQITYLLFLRRLDELEVLEENKSARLKTARAKAIYPKGKDPKGRPYQDLRWSRFKNLSPQEMYEVVGDHVFPFLRTLGGDDSTYAHHMKDASRQASSSRPASTFARTILNHRATRSFGTTSITRCSMASTSTAPCCASAA